MNPPETPHGLDRAYRMQKNTAKWRGIAWEFTFVEWLRLWVDSGHLHERGIGRGRYHMARIGDVGPYSPGNVEIVPHERNSADARRNHPLPTAEMSARQRGTGRGWSFVNGKYQVSVSRKYVGVFKTAAEAEAAYAAAAHRIADRGAS